MTRSNRGLLPQLAQQQQQRQMQQYMANLDAALRGVPGANPLITVEHELNNLVLNVNNINQTLAIVGNFQPLFDINWLTQEGKTDLSRIDLHYMATIGKQLLTDHTQYLESARSIAARLNVIVNTFNETKAIYNPSQSLIEEKMGEVLAQATVLHSEYVEWSETFMAIIGNSLADIIGHLNPLRGPDAQIINPFEQGLPQ